jgi:hypothetical protein
MMKKNASRLFGFCAIALLAACQANLPSEQLPDMTFKHLSLIQLRVIDIQLVSNFERSVDAPHVAHKFPVSPEKALMQWAEDRLQIAGQKNIARFTILRADAQEIPLKLDKSFKGMFKNQQSDRYDTFIEAQIEILDERNIRQASVTAKAEQSITVSEATPLTDRRKIWYNLVEKLMMKFNTAIENSIVNNFQGYLF